MKTYNHLFDSICSFENLMAAARAAERGRRLNDHAGRFRTRCQDTLRLMDAIIDNSNPQEAVCTVFPGDDMADAARRRVGLPIGNLTSQWFGGIYLTAFDHWVQESLGAGA